MVLRASLHAVNYVGRIQKRKGVDGFVIHPLFGVQKIPLYFFEWYNKKLLTLRDYYISQIEEKIPNAKLNGHRTQRLPGNANISIPSVQGEALLLNLDNEGICISTGSACTSGSLVPSHVLTAIGLSDELAQSSIRVTIGDENTKEDINFLIDKIIENVNKLAKK